jgi:arylsulfatase A-like enzyme
VDLYPTLLEVAGIQPEQERPRDGLSYLHLLLGRGTQRLDRDAIYWHFPGYLGAAEGAWRTLPVGALRAGDYKLLEFFEDGHLELYNLKDDLGERHDLAATHAQLAAELQAKLAAWRESVSAPMPMLRDASRNHEKSSPPPAP